MLQILFFLWVLAYIVSISKALTTYLRSGHAVKKLVAFLAVYGNSKLRLCPDESEYRDQLTDLLRSYPLISEFVSYPRLSYQHPAETTFQNAQSILPELQMKRNYLRQKVFQSLNPLMPVKEIVTLPLTVIRDMGFSPSKSMSMLVNALGWLICYFLEMFQPEIKLLLLSLL